MNIVIADLTKSINQPIPNTPNVNKYNNIFDVVYTFSNYGETEISLPHIHNFSLEQVEAKYLASSADCIHYATYYKSCECGAKGTETFIYEDGGYGEHIHTESKGKVDPTCHNFF